MGKMTISPVDTAGEEIPTVDQLLNRHADAIFHWNSIDARHVIRLPQKTPFDWGAVGYFAAFHNYQVRGYIILASLVDGRFRVLTHSEEDCPEEYIDASPGVLTSLSDTTHPGALRWRQLVQDRLRSTANGHDTEQADAA